MNLFKIKHVRHRDPPIVQAGLRGIHGENPTLLELIVVPNHSHIKSYHSQELCFMKIDWDVSLAIEFVNKWKKVLFESLQRDTICSSRHYLRGFDLNEIREIQLRGFSDTSLKAYAAVIFLRFILIDGSIFTSLVSLKTKVSPIKKQKLSVPRLELLACLLFTKLLKMFCVP